MSKVLFQWVDGGILEQFQLEKNGEQYRILMAVVIEVKRSLEGNAAVGSSQPTEQPNPASNEVHGHQADGSSPPPAVSSPPASVNAAKETAAASPAPRRQQARSEPSTKVRTPGRLRKVAANKQWAFCDNCKVNGKNQYIYGTRFKCGVCLNFDLCETCEASGVHAHHDMLRIGVIVKDEISWSRAWKPLHSELKKFCENIIRAPLNPSEGGHEKQVCDECNAELTGGSLKCTVCDDFDLCSACDKKSVHDHHAVMRFSGAVQGVRAWHRMGSRLHAELIDLHDYVIAAKGRPRVGPFDPDVPNVSSNKASKECRSKKAPSKTPSRSRPTSRRPQGQKRAASLTAGSSGMTLRKSARTSDAQASGPCAVIKSSSSTGTIATGRNSTPPSHCVRINAASALGESQRPLKSEEPAGSQTEANEAAAACSPLIGPLKTETSEAIENETAMS